MFYANGLFNHDVTSLILSNGMPTTAIQDAFNSAFICVVGESSYRSCRGQGSRHRVSVRLTFPHCAAPSLLTAILSSLHPSLLPASLTSHRITHLLISPLYSHHTAVPGYWLSVQYLERVGRKNVQMMGFIMMGVLFLICGMFRDWFLAEGAPFSRKVLFLVLYSLTFLFR